MARAVNEPEGAGRLGRRIERLGTALDGAAPGAFVLGLVAGGLAVSLLLWLWPAEQGALARYAQAFRQWCLGASGGSGGVEAGYVASLLAVPLVLAATAWFLWGSELRAAWRAPRRGALWASGGAGALVALVVTAGALPLQGEQAEARLPLDALRTSIEVPAFRLVDQQGRPTTEAALKGRVTVLSAAYSRCNLTCPLIVHDIRRALQQVPEPLREQVQVMLLSFDPAHDTPKVLSGMAERYRVAAPRWRLLTGEPQRLDALLRRLGFEYTVLGEGQITHANLFLVVGPDARVQWRFSLGQKDDLARAITRLAGETVVGAPTGG